ncbi:cullin-like protein, putative [Medicago truncatula]|uniref:Cullin-like protein, putative n=1 Tax=Medicago truncatula TaxID=3880 RepID=A0A072UU63_MEDTR|nr:cullin-like protein, putative [Medicago truncatula]
MERRRRTSALRKNWRHCTRESRSSTTFYKDRSLTSLLRNTPHHARRLVMIFFYRFRSTVFNLCSPNAIPCYDQEKYITSLPSLQEKQDEPLLRELFRRWSNYKITTKRLSSFFSPIDRHIELKFGFPSLEETRFLCFYHLVGDEIP